ncbi:hypothetical protein TWF102_004297 [Orbilia oligospora]|uniref:Uncharacterized protein n=1 Tax=Orbilia oligospora TaxID=2813651 RepID=A0A7C8NWQ6_ORBOL|nr:hypothetical protein TWF102_004297 [Orbilia oligospora]KAF3117839.1 hypothetical protein TWF103_004505 [Orbilia oligospora]KAF3151871.1 hypothetical protein TWF594_005638 [Orbilia oligospora]
MPLQIRNLNYVWAILVFYLLFRGNLALPLQGEAANTPIIDIHTNASIPAPALPVPPKQNGTTLAFLNDTSKQTEALEIYHSSSNKTSLAQDGRKRVVPSSIFHTEYKVRCKWMSPIIFDMPADPADYPEFMIFRSNSFSPERTRRPNYQQLMAAQADNPQGQMDIKTSIRGRIQKCHSCLCDQSTGRIMSNPVRPVRTGTMWCKPGDQLPLACQYWWGCYCDAKALQPNLIEGEDFQAHVDALNRLPQTFRDRNPDYVWAPRNMVFQVAQYPIIPNWAGQLPAIQRPPPTVAPSLDVLTTAAERVLDDGVGMGQIDANLLNVADQELRNINTEGQIDPDLMEEARRQLDILEGQIDPELLRVVQQELDLENLESVAGPSGTNRLYGPNDARGWDKGPFGGSGPGFGFGGGAGGGAGAGAVKKREVSTLNEAPGLIPGQELKYNN